MNMVGLRELFTGYLAVPTLLLGSLSFRAISSILSLPKISEHAKPSAAGFFRAILIPRKPIRAGWHILRAVSPKLVIPHGASLAGFFHAQLQIGMILRPLCPAAGSGTSHIPLLWTWCDMRNLPYPRLKSRNTGTSAYWMLLPHNALDRIAPPRAAGRNCRNKNQRNPKVACCSAVNEKDRKGSRF